MVKQTIYKSDSAKVLLDQLKNPFPTNLVKYRVGAMSKDKTKGIALFYIDARDVMKRLDDVCGIENWQSEIIPYGQGVICKLSIHMPNGDWICKSDGGEYTKVAQFKGACSDALKRAAVQFGVGRYLYYILNQWHPLTEYKTFVEPPQLPKFAYPNSDIQDWEELAAMEYDSALDINLEDLEFTDKEAEMALKESAKRKAELIASLKMKKQ